MAKTVKEQLSLDELIKQIETRADPDDVKRIVEAAQTRDTGIAQERIGPTKDNINKALKEINGWTKAVRKVEPEYTPFGARADIQIENTMKAHRTQLPAKPEVIKGWLPAKWNEIDDDSNVTLEKVKSLLAKGTGKKRSRFTVDDKGNYGLNE